MEGWERDLLQRVMTCCGTLRSTRASLIVAVSTGGSCVLLQAVLVNQGWECKGASGKAITARLGRIPVSKLCPMGFIFIWVDKSLVSHIPTSVALLHAPSCASFNILPVTCAARLLVYRLQRMCRFLQDCSFFSLDVSEFLV